MCRILDMHKCHGGAAWQVYDDKLRSAHAQQRWPFRTNQQQTGPANARTILCYSYVDNGGCSRRPCKYRPTCRSCGRQASTHINSQAQKPRGDSTKPPNSNAPP
ncbi:hypothetical protein LSAT2_031888 [Lamellibrachia satsuma]|nr:hypothetical protein LSAT2_031888 [Lamellibrachia satsuma]